MNMVERSFVILKYVNKVPTMASCTKCERKFFTPTAYQGDRVGAEQYLRGKFDLHKCEGDSRAKTQQW
ncbi:MAG: hypothetical protein WB781_25330 [Candidatus Sulfotelmatobacter sp.]